MYKARNSLLTENVQRLFILRSKEEDPRWKFNFYGLYAQTTAKQMCIPLYELKLCNNNQNAAQISIRESMN